LYVKGDYNLSARSLAVVGTRKYFGDKIYDERIIEDVVLSGYAIVSGMARGVDTMAHRVCIENGGKTIAVLGTGFGYSIKGMVDWIVDSGGCVLTEYPYMTEGSRFRFPQRNRIIAGLSLGTLVVAAPIRSGALITAKDALENGREIFGIPGAIYDENKKGIYKFSNMHGMKLVNCADDILLEFGDGGYSKTVNVKTSIDYNILSVLESPLSMDEISEVCGLDFHEVYRRILMLELDGCVRKNNCNWERCGVPNKVCTS
jgi:DNA processing protein